MVIFRWLFFFSSIEATLIDEQQKFPDRTDDPEQLPEMTELAVEHKIDIICIQELRYTLTVDIKYHDTGNGWTLATVNATVGGVGMLIGP